MMNDQSPADDDDADRLRPCGGSALRSYLELMRLPNAFTAMADVTMGFLFAQSAAWVWDPARDWWTLILLLVASSLLYIAGVVLNDVFDLETDRQQRPERPLPSGRIALGAAHRLGWGLLLSGAFLGVAGVTFGSGGGPTTGHFGSAAVPLLLAACIVLYDAWLKRTPLGPLAMGGCRFLNVLLGMSAAGTRLPADCWLVAGGIGLYVAGVTWFARREAETSNRLHLGLATLVMAAGIALLACFPHWSDRTISDVRLTPQRWYLLAGLLGLLILWRCLWAIVRPVPMRVRIAVAQCVLSIVMLDAVACYGVRGIGWACMILLLLLPAMFLGRWIEMT
jgi:hypothetical protein